MRGTARRVSAAGEGVTAAEDVVGGGAERHEEERQTAVALQAGRQQRGHDISKFVSMTWKSW